MAFANIVHLQAKNKGKNICNSKTSVSSTNEQVVKF
jgi:hypothetical protein